MLTLNNINTFYGNSHILYDLSLHVPGGKVVAILGRNGTGKTTTLRSIMGLTPPVSGEILFKGRNIEKLPSHKIAQMGVGYIPQGRRLFPSLTVEEHLSVYYRKGSPWTCERVLDFFPRLRERMGNKGGELSGGEQQMLAIGRALVTGPEFLIMDEPTEGLAPLIVTEVGRLINLIKQEGYAILLTEQKMKFALDLADEVYIISKGELVYHDVPEKLLMDEETKRTYLGV